MMSAGLAPTAISNSTVPVMLFVTRLCDPPVIPLPVAVKVQPAGAVSMIVPAAFSISLCTVRNTVEFPPVLPLLPSELSLPVEAGPSAALVESVAVECAGEAALAAEVAGSAAPEGADVEATGPEDGLGEAEGLGDDVPGDDDAGCALEAAEADDAEDAGAVDAAGAGSAVEPAGTGTDGVPAPGSAAGVVASLLPGLADAAAGSCAASALAGAARPPIAKLTMTTGTTTPAIQGLMRCTGFDRMIRAIEKDGSLFV